MRVLIVQHGEKERSAGDLGLTDLGRQQADVTGRWLAGRERPVLLVASPMRRARETAEVLARRLELAVVTDVRLRERMNWEGDVPLEDFLRDWERASADRRFVPNSGESSQAAAARFLVVLRGLQRSASDDDKVLIVSHGGVTTDLLRTILGDHRVEAAAPRLHREGVPCCAITTLVVGHGRWTVERIADTSHLTEITGSHPV